MIEWLAACYAGLIVTGAVLYLVALFFVAPLLLAAELALQIPAVKRWAARRTGVAW